MSLDMRWARNRPRYRITGTSLTRCPPNARKGWHKRATRSYCLRVFDEYKELDLVAFAGLVRALTGYDGSQWSQVREGGEGSDDRSPFARRLITGLAAEKYFESVCSALPEFEGCVTENTTRLGCGYDFRLRPACGGHFQAVEVKGLEGRPGSVSLTPKEYEAASALADRFFLFVVKNFREAPYHEIHRNPLAGGLRFKRQERVTVSVTWLATV